VQEWRAKNPTTYKLRGLPGKNLSERRSAAAIFAAGHTHSCLDCQRPYECVQACDPSNLKDSLCHGCFGGIQARPWSG